MSATTTTAPKRKSRRQAPKPLACTVSDTCEITGLGRTKLYELIAERKLRTVAIGKRRLVLYDSIEELIAQAAT